MAELTEDRDLGRPRSADLAFELGCDESTISALSSDDEDIRQAVGKTQLTEVLQIVVPSALVLVGWMVAEHGARQRHARETIADLDRHRRELAAQYASEQREECRRVSLLVVAAANEAVSRYTEMLALATGLIDTEDMAGDAIRALEAGKLALGEFPGLQVEAGLIDEEFAANVTWLYEENLLTAYAGMSDQAEEVGGRFFSQVELSGAVDAFVAKTRETVKRLSSPAVFGEP